jgi:hyperosmotically inducible periplasmic protein
MKYTRKTSVASAALAAVCLFVPVFATAQAAPDNTKQNQEHATTADSQSNASADRATTAKVRKAIMADKNLSTYAHNVKVITNNGQVTLKGPVRSEEEKQQIVSDASAVVTAENVINQMTVKQ